MKIPDTIRKQYTTFDPEADLVFQNFDEPEKSKILEVGSQDCPIASMLAKCDFQVVGVDLRTWDQEKNYTHIQADFCRLPIPFLRENLGTFDSAISISTLEHFGLGTYQEQFTFEYYDVLASRYVYDLLRSGGTFYLTVPFGGKYVANKPHWRVYDWASFGDRLCCGFILEKFYISVVEEITIDGRKYSPGENIAIETALANISGFPNIACFAKLRKP